MITTLSFALGVAMCSASTPGFESLIQPVVADSTYKALYEGGETFSDFVAKATARKEQWEANYAKGVVLVRLANGSTEMRLINATVGKEVMETHRTPDGRGATPTVILLDAEFNERGCWVERPATLVDLMKNGTDFEGKMAWYDKDNGASSLEEIVQVIEAAHAGSKKCAPDAK